MPARSTRPEVTLKCWPEQFSAVLAGRKRHEVRVEDRHRFVVGDRLLLREWNPRHRIYQYTGRQVLVLVSHVTRGPDFGLPVGLACMSIEVVTSLTITTTTR